MDIESTTATLPQAGVSRRARGSGRTPVEKLAAHWNCPLERVERLYASELTMLEAEAKIQTFVPLVALRRVRDVLRRGTPS